MDNNDKLYNEWLLKKRRESKKRYGFLPFGMVIKKTLIHPNVNEPINYDI